MSSPGDQSVCEVWGLHLIVLGGLELLFNKFMLALLWYLFSLSCMFRCVFVIVF